MTQKDRIISEDDFIREFQAIIKDDKQVRPTAWEVYLLTEFCLGHRLPLLLRFQFSKYQDDAEFKCEKKSKKVMVNF